MAGNVVGINSSIRSSGSASTQAGSIGLGFAIPIDDVLEIVDQLAAGEPPTHARLGIGVEDANTASTAVQITDGAVVGEITEGSAAEALVSRAVMSSPASTTVRSLAPTR